MKPIMQSLLRILGCATPNFCDITSVISHCFPQQLQVVISDKDPMAKSSKELYDFN